MKAIVFGDIHANLPALEEAFAQAEREGYDAIAHTGDVVGYGAFPSECVRFLHDRNIAGVRGNFDDNVASRGDDSGAGCADPAELLLAEASFAWTCGRVDAWSRRRLADLPFELTFDLGGRRVAVYHGGPVDLHWRLTDRVSDDRLSECGRQAQAEIVVSGNVHRVFQRGMDGRLFVNAGSVGRPGDGDPRTGYAVIESDASPPRVSFRRFAYDVERAALAVRERGLPGEIADRLLKGL